MKTILVAILAIAALTSKANNGGGEDPIMLVKMEVKQVTATKVQVLTNLVVKANESYEIQKSYNGKDFTVVAMILGTEETATMPALRITDIVKTEAKATYRIVKVEPNGKTIISSAQSL